MFSPVLQIGPFFLYVLYQSVSDAWSVVLNNPFTKVSSENSDPKRKNSNLRQLTYIYSEVLYYR